MHQTVRDHTTSQATSARKPFFGGTSVYPNLRFSTFNETTSPVNSAPADLLQRQREDPPATGETETRPEAPAAEGSTAPPAPPAPLSCNPQPLSRADFLARNGNDTSEFGHTNILISGRSAVLSNPTLNTRRVGGRHVFDTIQHTPPSVDSIYTQAGSFIEGQSANRVSGDGCMEDFYDLEWVITADGAAKIRDAELEHCADYNYAYQENVVRLVEEVNRLAAAGTRFDSERAAKRALRRRLGFEPDDWYTRLGCMLNNTTVRDYTQRGEARGWHTPIVNSSNQRPPSYRSGCRSVRILISARSLPAVGRHPSSSIIPTGC